MRCVCFDFKKIYFVLKKNLEIFKKKSRDFSEGKCWQAQQYPSLRLHEQVYIAIPYFFKFWFAQNDKNTLFHAVSPNQFLYCVLPHH